MEVNRVEERKLPFLLLLWLSLQLLAWRILHWDNESRLFSFIFNLHSLGGLVNRGSLSYLVFSSRDGVKLRKDTRPTTLATYQTKRKIKTETTESSLVKISHHPTVKSNPSVMRGLFKLSGETPQYILLVHFLCAIVSKSQIHSLFL